MQHTAAQPPLPTKFVPTTPDIHLCPDNATALECETLKTSITPHRTAVICELTLLIQEFPAAALGLIWNSHDRIAPTGHCEPAFVGRGNLIPTDQTVLLQLLP